jgi:protein-S-isoprenylcysteine O-methyltransferase Ste14
MLGSPVFWLILLNLVFFAISLLVASTPDIRERFFKMPRLLQQAFIIPVVVPQWILPFFPQPRFEELVMVRIDGAMFIVVAAVLLVAAFRKIGVIPSELPEGARKGLITTGIYGVIRNPIYTANMAMTLGLALVFRGLYALAYVPAVCILFALITFFEEKDLLQIYGDRYAQYLKKVPYRFIPKVV